MTDKAHDKEEIDWIYQVNNFMFRTRMNTEAMARLCSCSVYSVQSWRTGRSSPPERRMIQLMSAFELLVERHEDRAAIRRQIDE